MAWHAHSNRYSFSLPLSVAGVSAMYHPLVVMGLLPFSAPLNATMLAFHLCSFGNGKHFHCLQSTPNTKYQIPNTEYRDRAFFLYPIGRIPSSVKALHLPNMIFSGSFPLPLPAVPILSALSVSNGLQAYFVISVIAHAILPSTG